VVDEALVPIARACISQHGEGERVTLSAADGAFGLAVESDRWKRCTLRVEAEGFATRTLEADALELGRWRRAGSRRRPARPRVRAGRRALHRRNGVHHNARPVRAEVRPGANTWEQDLALGRLAGRCLSATPEMQLFLCRVDGTEPSCWLPIQPDESGRYVLPFVPAGRGLVRRADDVEWVTLIETEVLAGRERTLELP
jgi:hypothetical protein